MAALLYAVRGGEGWGCTSLKNLQKFSHPRFVFTDNSQSCDIAKNLPPSQNRVLDGGRLHFSSLVATSTRGHAVHMPPFVDFLKPYFAYNIGRRTNPPFLKGTCIPVSCLVFSEIKLDIPVYFIVGGGQGDVMDRIPPKF